MTNNSKAVLFFAVLVCLNMLPNYKFLYQRLVTVYELPLEGLEAVHLGNGDVLEQELIVRGKMKELKLFTEDYGKENEGALKITVLQDGKPKEIIEWALRNAGDYQYSEIPIHTDKLAKGNVHIRMEAQNFTGDTIFAVFVANEDIYENKCAIYNGASMNAPLLIQYTAKDYFTSETIYSFLMIAAIAAACAVIAFLLTHCKETAKSSCFLVLSVWAMVFFFLAFKYPVFTFYAEPWAELGMEFLPAAQSKDIVGSLFRLEGGLYLSLFNRLVCLAVVKLFGMGRYTILILQLFAAFFAAFCCSYICSMHFRKYAPRYMRVLFSIALVSILAGGENITVIGVVYFGIIFLILCLLLDFSEISNAKCVAFTVMSVIFCLSKMSFCVIVPAAVFYLIFAFRMIDKKKKVYLCIVSAAALLQVAASLWLAGGLHTTAELGGESGIGFLKTASLWELIHAALYYQVQILGVSTCLRTVGKVMGMSGALAIVINLFLLLFIAGILAWSAVTLLHNNKERKEIAVQILALGILSFAQCFLSVATTTTEVVGLENWKNLQYVFVTRWFQAAYTAVLFIILLLAGMVFQKWNLPESCRGGSFPAVMVHKKEVLKKGMYAALYLAVFIFVIDNRRGDDGLEYFAKSRLAFSDWNSLCYMLDRERYCIPIIPNGWAMTNELYYPNYAYRDNVLYLNEAVHKADAVYVEKYHYTNMLSDRKYYAYLYDGQNQVIGIIEQCTNPEKRLVGFDFYDIGVKIAKIEFKYADGTDAFIDGMYIVGYV